MRSHGEGCLSATTQVKVLSSEIIHIAQGQGFHILETNISTIVKGEIDSDVPESESVAGKRTVYVGTWENRSVPNGSFQEAEEATREYGVSVVGLTHSRGVDRVMPVESLNFVTLEGVGSPTQGDMRSVMPYTDIGYTWQKLSLISGHARRDPAFEFTSLAHLLNVEYLRDCYKSLNRNKAVGIDNVSWEEYGSNLDENLEHLVSRLKLKKYKPIPAKRVYIPKSETEKRPLGISALENKVVERGITWILESIYDQDFLPSSYGFRPKKNCHQALKERLMGRNV